MPLDRDLKDAISKITTDSKLFHDIVHGSQEAVVVTEGGEVKTVSKALHDIEAQLAHHLATIERAAKEAKLLWEQTQQAEASAKSARDEILQTGGTVKASPDDQHPGALKDKLIVGAGLQATLKQQGNQDALEINVAAVHDASAKLYLSAHFI